MVELDTAFCPNQDCKDYGLRGHGNIGIRARYGKSKKRELLYCRSCNKRFAASKYTAFFGLRIEEEKIRQIMHHTAAGVSVRGTARLMKLDKDTVNRVVLMAGEHCSLVLSSLLKSLMFAEDQFEELWAFMKNRGLFQKRT